MKAIILTITFCITTQLLLSQDEDGVVAFDLPVRNSLMFNKYAINPTFSFVREQYNYASIYNKREWTQFEDAPITYLASYSGRFGENIGAGIGVFQQNYGVLTTFGGLLNFAYNARLDRDSNLTFGLNLGAYSSGINTSNVTSNFPDPSLQNVPSNLLVTVSPGINYGTAFLDFGVSINNLVSYNFESSEILENNPKQGIQGHVMYTGYMSSRGFFDDARFSGLVRSEFRREETIISANAMIYVPRGIWFQGGYNTLYGASAGVGINVTKEIAIEYNFEKALGDIIDFGPSHEVTLAYRFNNRRYFDYSRQDEVSGLINTDKKPKRRIVKSTAPKRKVITPAEPKKDNAKALAKAEEERIAKEKAEILKQEENNRLAEEKRKSEELAITEQKRLEEAKRIARAKIEADKRAKAEEEKKKKEADRLEKERLAEQQKVNEALKRQQEEAEALRLEQERITKEKEAADRLAKAEAERLEAKKLVEEQKAKEELERQQAEATRLEQERLVRENTESNIINNPKSKIGKELKSVADAIENDNTKQTDLLDRYNKAVENKNENLKNLKEENDLSDQGITVQPKEFRSVTKENNELRAVKSQLDNIIEKQNESISELEELYKSATEADTIVNETVLLFYKKKLSSSKAEQAKTQKIRAELENRLENIQERIEFEKRRRIKRAEYDNEEERYQQDRARLANLKSTTEVASANYTEDDFDFGITQSNNITILKNVNNINSGYYLVLAVHTDTDKRDDFITKVIASGVADIEFFFDVNTSQYYIYQKKFQNIQQANSLLKQRGTKPYNSKMTIIKIEN
ncbi:PorP/SprF family type IX secretion system membrane protein [Winogradskyella litorisediminis]|uniref:PorP/SprF family type IX secretion system membrane protein n=1 Tax=Winogradskyella litorisediminis TaxID=1156618 RepID=A0ABW3N2S0_9FLAO